MSDSGLYVIVLSLSKTVRTRVGALGVIEFTPGTYFYIGSAKKNLAARVGRHKRRTKPLRWHIDYFRRHAKWVKAILYHDMRDECALAAHVIETVKGQIAYPRFGASDCGCAGHLVKAENDIIYFKI